MKGTCRSCRSTLLDVALDLGDQPASDAFPLLDDPAPDPRWPLVLCYCRTCSLVQLGGADAPVPEAPLAVESSTMLEHARRSAGRLVSDLSLQPGTTVTEFDSHHGGSWLSHLLEAGLRPTPGRADLVVDVHGLAHEPDLDAALAQRVARLAPGGRIVFEFHHLLQLVEQNQYDTVRHGHPLYLSLRSLAAALARHGLFPLDARAESSYGGSLVVVAGSSGDPEPGVADTYAAEERCGLTDVARLRALHGGAEASSASLRRWLESSREQGRRVLGYGAPSKAVVLLNWAGITRDLLPFTADLSPAKQGRRIPGVAIPIGSPADLVAAHPDDVLVLTWDIVDEVRQALPEIEAWGGRFWTPHPEPRVHESR